MSELDISITSGNESSSSSDSQEIIVITDPATDRYNTYGFISWWKQEVVSNSTVMVIGAGALGNEVLKNLALMGIGKIFVADFDTIDDSNLSRSVLYRMADEGKKKAEVAAEAVREMNPDVAVQWFHGNINHDLGLGVYRRMDVVIGCLDNREARLSINVACWHLNKPWVDGAIQELLGVARVFKPGDGACYECTLTDEDYRIINVRNSCRQLAIQNIVQGKVPTTPTISSIIAGIETQEALKLLHGMEVISGRGLVFNGLMNDVYTTEYPVKEDCQSHWIWQPIVELPWASAEKTTLKKMWQEACKLLGPTTTIAIPPFVTEMECLKCGKIVPFNRPIHTISVEEGNCTDCKDIMQIHRYERIKGDEPFLDRTLAEIGIPPLDILPASNESYEEAFFELTGDEETFFCFTKSSAETQQQFYARRKQWQTQIKSK